MIPRQPNHKWDRNHIVFCFLHLAGEIDCKSSLVSAFTLIDETEPYGLCTWFIFTRRRRTFSERALSSVDDQQKAVLWASEARHLRVKKTPRSKVLSYPVLSMGMKAETNGISSSFRALLDII